MQIDEEKLARALFDAWSEIQKPRLTYGDITDALARAAIAYIVPREREECAKVADAERTAWRGKGPGAENAMDACAFIAADCERNMKENKP
jgi:hypothetical protein